MSTEYPYILDKSSKKHHCPECGKKRFVRYIDTSTGEYLPEQYGRCDKGDGHYFLNPYKDGYLKTNKQHSFIPKAYKPPTQTTVNPVYFDFEMFKLTGIPDRYDNNVFIQNLLNRVKYPFSESDVSKVINLYRLGTVAKGYRAGAVCFPFIDINQNVRTIQVKQFDEQNHSQGNPTKLDKVILSGLKKENRAVPEWLTKYIEYGDKYGYFTCLFGEHLLSLYPNNPIALVEAPKTAVYGWLYFNELELTKDWLWLAVYNKSSFSFDKLKVLQGRFVYVFPDLSKDGSTFNEWQTKAKEFEKRLTGTRFIFSDLLEKLATPKQREEGEDMADVLIQYDWRKFRKQPPPQSEASEAPKTNILLQPEPLTDNNTNKEEHPDNWNNEIAELETFFASIELPTQPIKLNKCSTISDCRLFIESHLETVKASNGKRYSLPYLHRLQELKSILSQN